MKVVETTALIHKGDWLVMVNDQEKKAVFVKVEKVSDVSHTGVDVQDSLGLRYSIDASGGALTFPEGNGEQEVYHLKDIVRGQSPLYLLVGDDPVLSKGTTTVTLHIRDSEFQQPARLTTTVSEVSPQGSNFNIQVDTFSRAHFNHAGECSTGAHKDVAIVHARLTWK